MAARAGQNGPGSPPGDAGRLDRQVIVVASVVVLGAIMSILDTTIVNVALQTLARDFRTSLATIQWVVTGYMLSLAVVIPLAGWATERFGARRVWMTSIVLFVAGSALCGAAWSPGSLIVFRILQGIGGGMVMPVGMTILTQAAGPARVGRVMSVIGVPMLLGPVLGPVLGGLIVQDASWRWIFFVNVPIGAAALALAVRLLPRSPAQPCDRLDWRGFLLLSPGLAAFTYGLAEIAEHGGLGEARADVALVVGIVLVALFARHAWGRSGALLDIGLFRRIAFSSAAGTTFLVGAGLFGGMILLPLYYQEARGSGALDAGLLMAPQGLGAALVMPLSGRLTDRLGGGRLVVPGIVLVALGTIPFTQLGPHTSYALLTGALVVRGIGMGFSMMPAMAAAYATLVPSAVPRATSTLNVLQRVGGSIGTALLAVVLQARIHSELHVTGPTTGAAVPPHVRAAAAEPLARAFGQTFWGVVVLTLIALLPALILARQPPPGAQRERAEERPPSRAGTRAEAETVAG